MKIVISGATGMLASQLAPHLVAQGHEVVGLSRAGGEGAIAWNPAKGELDAAALEGVDAVVHLAGANVGAGRWTASRKREILESRVQSTRLLVAALEKLARPPRLFLGASASGYYGDTGEGAVDESAPSGKGFLADVCRQWEDETSRAAAWSERVVMLRMAVVLSPAGGALARLLPFFRGGVGGPIGGGEAWMSWITPDDVAGAVEHILRNAHLQGPVNLAAPGAVRNRDFAAVLGRVLHRPAVTRVPAVALRLRYGQMAEETVLASSHVLPAVLQATGYRFRFPELEPALRHVLGR